MKRPILTMDIQSYGLLPLMKLEGASLRGIGKEKALFVAITICVFSNNRAVKSIRRNCCVGMVTVSGAKQISAHK